MATGTLNTTSYAVLALLGVRSWTTYELAQQMERSLSWFWPRATSVIYEEPKKLVAHGLARAGHAYTGRRRSTVYSITEAGRATLRDWLDRPAAGPSLEFEALVKVAFADHGNRDQLLATLAAIRADAQRRRDEARARIDEYRATEGPFPQRLPVIAITGKLLAEHCELLATWAAWAEDEVRRWPGVTPCDGATVPAAAFTPGWPGLDREIVAPPGDTPAPPPPSAG